MSESLYHLISALSIKYHNPFDKLFWLHKRGGHIARFNILKKCPHKRGGVAFIEEGHINRGPGGLLYQNMTLASIGSPVHVLDRVMIALT